MSFTVLLVRNLLRQPAHSGLTMLGIALGIATVIALGTVTTSLREAVAATIDVGGGDFVVAQRTTAGLTYSSISAEDAARIATRPGVASTLDALISVIRVGSDPYFHVVGVDVAAAPAVTEKIRKGRLPTPGVPDEVIVGERAAGRLHMAPGDYVTLGTRTFLVTGIYRTGNIWLDGGACAPLATVQEMAAREGTVTMVYVQTAPGVAVEAEAQAIEVEFPHLLTITSLAEYRAIEPRLQVADASNVAVSMLAIAIGALGVMNTMARAVYERTREIGVLRALGWNSPRILGMVLGESIVLCLAAGVAGSVLSFAAVRAVMMNDLVRSLVVPEYTAGIFARAFLIAFGVALVGGAYPAFRAVRLRPIEALRHE